LYSYIADISAVCGPIGMMVIPKWRGRRWVFNEDEIRGYGGGT